MLNVAILTGGPAAERGISLKSAGMVERNLDTSRYNSSFIIMEEGGWVDRDSGSTINLNDFSLPSGKSQMRFDFVFLMIHGTPAVLRAVEEGHIDLGKFDGVQGREVVQVAPLQLVAFDLRRLEGR